MAFYKRVQHDEYENTYTLIRDGHKILHPVTKIPPLNQPEEKLAPSKLEEPSNTLY